MMRDPSHSYCLHLENLATEKINEQKVYIEHLETRELGFLQIIQEKDAEISRLQATIEQAVTWIQEDCPFTRDEIMAELSQELKKQESEE